MRKNNLVIRAGLIAMALAIVLQILTSIRISTYTHGLETNPTQGLLVAGPMLFGTIAALFSPVWGAIFAAIINLPGLFVSWIGTAGGDPWMVNKAFSQATFIGVAIFYLGLGWHLYMQRKIRKTKSHG